MTLNEELQQLKHSLKTHLANNKLEKLWVNDFIDLALDETSMIAELIDSSSTLKPDQYWVKKRVEHFINLNSPNDINEQIKLLHAANLTLNWALRNMSQLKKIDEARAQNDTLPPSVPLITTENTISIITLIRTNLMERCNEFLNKQDQLLKTKFNQLRLKPGKTDYGINGIITDINKIIQVLTENRFHDENTTRETIECRNKTRIALEKALQILAQFYFAKEKNEIFPNLFKQSHAHKINRLLQELGMKKLTLQELQQSSQPNQIELKTKLKRNK